MKINYGAMATIVGSLNLKINKKRLTNSELAQVHDVVQRAIYNQLGEKLGDMEMHVTKVIIINLDEDHEP